MATIEGSTRRTNSGTNSSPAPAVGACDTSGTEVGIVVVLAPPAPESLSSPDEHADNSSAIAHAITVKCRLPMHRRGEVIVDHL